MTPKSKQGKVRKVKSKHKHHWDATGMMRKIPPNSFECFVICHNCGAMRTVKSEQFISAITFNLPKK